MTFSSRFSPALLFCILAIPFFASAGDDDPGKTARQKILHERLLDHFNWGIPGPTPWMKETAEKNGARWDIRDGYLSGGAGDTEDVWWMKYGAAEGSLKEGIANGWVVWFTFYSLAQSPPARYKPGPAQATPANAKIPETMKAYFTNFKRLMQLCGKYPQAPAVVQLEPDEWCHLLLSAGLDPSKVDVKVGSCGLEELKGLPDNEFGWAAAFAKLRDQYAPHVLLSCNPSGWDWKGSMSGKKMGALFKEICAGRYELATFETGDRDKGCTGKAPPYGDSIAITGSLDNHLKWIEEFHAASGLYVFVWQVAMGNTYFKTCNNTPGHECDNLAQLLLEDYPKNQTIARYVNAGCAGWLFQGGQGESTCAWDEKKDGITNPEPISGNLGKTSEYTDDDGGYIRLRVGNYYKQPYPILGKTPAPSATSSSSASDSGKTTAAAPAATAKPKSYKLIDNAALESFKSTLRTRTADRIIAGSSPHIDLPSLHANARVISCDAKGNMRLRFADDSEMDYTWSQLGSPELASLAASVAQSESEDRAMAAFFCLWNNKPDSAKIYFEKSPECEQKVRAAFEER